MKTPLQALLFAIALISLSTSRATAEESRITLSIDSLPPVLQISDLEVDLVFENEILAGHFFATHSPQQIAELIENSSFSAFIGQSEQVVPALDLTTVLDAELSGNLQRTLCSDVIAKTFWINYSSGVDIRRNRARKPLPPLEYCPWFKTCPQRKCIYEKGPNDHGYNDVLGNCERDIATWGLCLCD